MPLSPEQLHELLNYLDANLEACNHTTKLTRIFLAAEQLDQDKFLSWLGEQGGFCDCEVLANLVDFVGIIGRSVTPGICVESSWRSSLVGSCGCGCCPRDIT